MTHKFFLTNNAKWFAVRPPLIQDIPNGHRSERVELYLLIEASPGIDTETLEAKWNHKVNMKSRLSELYHNGFVRFERIADLFKEQ